MEEGAARFLFGVAGRELEVIEEGTFGGESCPVGFLVILMHSPPLLIHSVHLVSPGFLTHILWWIKHLLHRLPV